MARRSQSHREDEPLPLPGFLEFLQPRLVVQPPSGSGWVHEIKFDGYRFQGRVQAGDVTLFTRRGFDWTAKLPELAADLAALPNCILDGELCFLDANGHPAFSGLRSAIGRGVTADLVFYAFDILWRGEEDLRSLPLTDRKDILARTVAPIEGQRVRLAETFPTGGAALLQSACRLGLEGIVSKRSDSLYASGRGEAWVKAKCRLAQEFVIGGWVRKPADTSRASSWASMRRGD